MHCFSSSKSKSEHLLWSPACNKGSLGSVLLIATAISALGVFAVGLGTYFQVGALSNLAQMNGIAMMSAGGASALVLAALRVLTWMKCQKQNRRTSDLPKSTISTASSAGADNMQAYSVVPLQTARAPSAVAPHIIGEKEVEETQNAHPVTKSHSNLSPLPLDEAVAQTFVADLGAPQQTKLDESDTLEPSEQNAEESTPEETQTTQPIVESDSSLSPPPLEEAVAQTIEADLRFQNESNSQVAPSPIEVEELNRVVEKEAAALKSFSKFGKAEWELFYGSVGDEPPLPDNLEEILDAPCPFSNDPSIKVRDTHSCRLMVATVDEKPLSLNYLNKLAQNPKNGGRASRLDASFCNFKTRDYIENVIDGSYWVLMLDVVPESLNKNAEEQKLYLDSFKQMGYSLPTVLEAAVFAFTTHASSEKNVLGEKPSKLTRCADEVVGFQLDQRDKDPKKWKFLRTSFPIQVGGHGPEGLNVGICLNTQRADYIGIAPVRRL